MAFTLRIRLLAILLVFASIHSKFKSAVAAEISFRNDVMPVLSKSGCNLGTCHGNARGKGGFQISLRGQDPAADFPTLSRELFSRRANILDPDRSLLLLKPTMQLAHEGGKRFQVDSAEYRTIRDWIANGMPDDAPNVPRLVRLSVTPEEVFLPASALPGSVATTGETSPGPGGESTWQQQISATAEFSDGTTRDVSSVAVYETSQPIAEVSRSGLVSGRSAGELTVLVRYQQQQVPVRISFLPDRADFRWTAPAAANFIDQFVFARLQKLRINPSLPCDDATFIRRVTFDLLGLPPTADEARRFVSDPSASKRAALIDSHLERPEFSDWWAMKWADLLRIEEKTLDRKGVENFHAWLRESFATHKPLDRMAREIVAARGSTYEVPAANFYRALRTPFERSEAIGQLFLGVRLQCSKCHNHPFDRWTQDDYYSWGSVFARIDYKIVENRRRDSNDKHEFDGEQIVFLNESGEAKDPRTNSPRLARFLGGDDASVPTNNPLNGLADWLTDPHNERFVQMLANRTWQQVTGRGIVDPIDDFRATNPPSNPELLRALSNHLAFGAFEGRASASTNSAPHAFDLRSLLRAILNSYTYQSTSEPNDTNRDDEINFSRAIVRRYSAEQLLDASSQILDVPLEFAGYPSGRRAAQLAGVGAIRLRNNGPTEADQFLKLFGKPPRLQSCDCERSDEATLGQTFQMVSGPLMNRLLSTKGNRLERMSASGMSATDIVTELYWMTLTRPPTDVELTTLIRYLDASGNRRTALEDIVWGLFNSNEFLLRR